MNLKIKIELRIYEPHMGERGGSMQHFSVKACHPLTHI